jgi:pyruvate dehydrogenase E2 component (dihydrolipoamide acetyltransferase)
MSEARVEVPDIGDATDVDVVEVLIKAGQRVERDQGLIVLESDKASMEVPSPFAGTIKSVALGVGDKVSKGSLILLIDTDGAGAAAGTAAAAPAKEKPAAEKPAAKSNGDGKGKPARAQPVPESAPELLEEESEEQGEVRTRREVEAQDDRPSRPQTPAPTRTIPPPDFSAMPAEPAQPPKEKKPHATPAIRQFARELGVDLAQVPGSGPHARITKDDVLRYVKHAMSVAGTATGTGFAVPELPEIDFRQFGEISTQPLTKIQKLSGRNLHRSWITIPHVTQFDEADITELEEFRHKMRAERPEVKLTLTSFFMRRWS